MTISRRSLRKLICFDCGKFLSVGPIKVTDAGLAICGRCNGGAAPIHEAANDILKSIEFPCSNAIYGCRTIVNWDDALQHENACSFAKDEGRTLNDDSLKIFEGISCFQCKNVLNVPPIHQKEADVGKDSIAGHEKEVQKCKWPDCGETLALDGIESHEECCLERSCCYSGCTEAVSGSRIQDHQNTCSHKWNTLNTYCCYILNCTFTFEMANLIGHIKQVHWADRIITGNTVQHTVAASSSYDAVYLRCHYSIFRFNTCFVSDNMWCWCWYLGKEEDQPKYEAVLEFSNDAVTLRKTIKTIYNSPFQLGDETAKFLRNDAITFRVTINKA